MAEGNAKAGRKRSDAAHRAILDATWGLLAERGYGALTIEAVAKSAGVGKQTIYRWWSSKGELVLETVAVSAKARVSAGASLRKGLEAYLSSLARSVRGPDGAAHVLSGLMAEAQLDPKFAVKFQERFLAPHRDALLSILRHHQDATTHAEVLVDMALGVIWYRVLTGGPELNDDATSQLARDLAKSSERYRE
jgi:AcrR family transcriptional regulator